MRTTPRQYSVNEITHAIFRKLIRLSPKRKERLLIIQRYLDIFNYPAARKLNKIRQTLENTAVHEADIQQIATEFRQKCLSSARNISQDEIKQIELYTQIKHDALAELSLRSIHFGLLDTRFKVYIMPAIVGLAAVGTIGLILWDKLSHDRQKELE